LVQLSDIRFYLAIATGTTAHRMLYLETPLNLPGLNIGLQLLGFYVLHSDHFCRRSFTVSGGQRGRWRCKNGVITSSTNSEEAAMTDQKMQMEVPTPVREFAEKSVDQAEKAISAFMESASKSVVMVPGPMTDVAKQALAITEANLRASFEHARKLIKAKDIDEVMKLQSEFLRNQFGAATEQFKQMTGVATSAAKDISNEKPELI
jgi:phasin